MVLLCKRFNVGLNTLWQWTYCLLVLMAEGYLLYRAVLQCKDYNELPWPSSDKPVTELYVYIALIVISLMCIPFFFITAIFKVGNYANDGVRLGRDDILDPTLAPRLPDLDEQEVTQSVSRNSQLLWKHSGPLCVGFHVMAAFALLLPTVLMDAQKIKHGFLHPGVLWRSELDVLVEDRAVLQFGLPVANSTIPVPTPDYSYKNEWETMSPEFINYLLALIVFSIRYPSVFWYTKISFSLIFSSHLLIATVYYVFAYCSYALVYKFRMNAGVKADLDLKLPLGAVVVLFLLANTVVYFSSVAIFHYGYQQYHEAYIKHMMSRRLRRRLKPQQTGCQGYMPHTAATVALVLFVSFRAPIVYDCVTLYRKTGNTVSLAAIIWDVCYMFLWILMWFFFTIKQSWFFRIHVNLPVNPQMEFSQDNHVQEQQVVPKNEITNENNNAQNAVQNSTNINGMAVIPTVSQTVDNVGNKSPDEQDSIAPNRASALRKSKERRNGNVHVTFDDSRDAIIPPEPEGQQIPKVDPLVLPNESPTRKRRRKKDAARCSNSPEVEPSQEEKDITEDPKPFKREKSRSMFGGFPLDTTPENTLTRNYRHSIRDKCGQYYRNSREFNAPPAAQSSPVLPPRQRNSNVPAKQAQNFVINPNSKKPKILGPRDQTRQISPVRHVDNALSLHPAHHPSGRHSSPVRQPSPVRHSSPSRNDVNHHQSPSRSVPLSAQNSLPCLPPSVQSSEHLTVKHRNSSPIRTSTHISGSTDILTKPPLADRSRNMNPSPLSHRNDVRGLNTHTNIADLPPARPPRELRIVGGKSSKPDMGRRDSALPSSNETSSNDSGENVLCSQV